MHPFKGDLKRGYRLVACHGRYIHRNKTYGRIAPARKLQGVEACGPENQAGLHKYSIFSGRAIVDLVCTCHCADRVYHFDLDSVNSQNVLPHHQSTVAPKQMIANASICPTWSMTTASSAPKIDSIISSLSKRI